MMVCRWLSVIVIGAWLLTPVAKISPGVFLSTDEQPLFSPTPRPVILDARRALRQTVQLKPESAGPFEAPKKIIYHALFTPNDPYFSAQWNLSAMNVPAAWDVDQTAPIHGGDPRIIVAVLDTGLASTLLGGAQSVPDIVPSTVWTNVNEIPGDSIDNDHNGYVDDVHGWNFISPNARPIDDSALSHGTHVSSVIAAATDNSLATAGMASNVTIMPLKVLNGAGDGTTDVITQAVQYAVSQGAAIINLSFGGDEPDEKLHQAIQAAVQQGVVVIGAAGNGGTDGLGDGAVTYPARYSEVISVGATTTLSTRATYSNYGPDLTMVAPGDVIPAQACTDATCTAFAIVLLSGTSQAAAEVSAVAALLESCGATPGNIRSLLTTTARDLGATGRDDEFGDGQVDASAALTAAGCVTTAPAAPGAITAQASTVSAVPVVSNRPSPYTKPVFSWTGPSGATFSLTWKKGSTVVTQTKQTTTSFSPTISGEASYTLSVTTIDALGQASTPAMFTYRYQRAVVAVSSGSTIQLLKNDFTLLRSMTSAIGKMLSVAGGTLRTTTVRLMVSAQPKGATLALQDSQGKTIRTVQPFGKNFVGTMTSTMLQRANGTSIIVVATNTNGASVAWYSASGQLIGRNTLYAAYTGGVNISSGDLNGDGTDELIVAQTHGPEIRVYSADRKRLNIFTPRGQTFKQGWSITAGDVDGDGLAEIAATPYVSAAKAKVLILNGQGKELRNWLTTGSTFGPMLLQAADLNGDGLSEILTAPQSGAGALQQRSGTGTLLKQVKLTSTLFRSLTRL